MRVKKDKQNTKSNNKITNYFKSKKFQLQKSQEKIIEEEDEEEPQQLNLLGEYRRLRALRDLNRKNWDNLPIYYKIELNSYRKYSNEFNENRGLLTYDVDNSINKLTDVSKSNLFYYKGNINVSQYLPINSQNDLTLNPITQGNKIFEGCAIYVPDYTRCKITSLLRILILRNGGEVRADIRSQITHMVYPILDYPKKCVLIKLFSLQGLPKIVTPYWILDSLRVGKRLSCLNYMTDKSMNTLMNYFEILDSSNNNKSKERVDGDLEAQVNDSDNNIYS